MRTKAMVSDIKPYTQGSKRFRQKRQIIRILYEHGETTIPEFSKLVGISIPTTTLLLNELIELGAVKVKGIGETRRGRKPTLFELVDSYLYVVSCEMNRFESKMAIFNCHNELVSDIITVDTYYDDPGLIEKLVGSFNMLVARTGIPEEKISAFGLCMPGLVDTHEGINHTIQNPHLKAVKKLLKSKLQKFIYVDNDARMQAFGEYRFGKAMNHRNALVINWDWGIGLGLILNGEIYSGAQGFAGELSHIMAQEDGKLCICGKRGCFETVTSTGALLEYARESIASNSVSQLTKRFSRNPEELKPGDIINAARTGDELSISLLSKVGLAMGKGLSTLIQLLNPEIIVFQGTIAKANQFVMTPVQQSLNKYCLEALCSNLIIEVSDLDEKAGLLGTTATVFRAVLNEPVISQSAQKSKST